MACIIRRFLPDPGRNSGHLTHPPSAALDHPERRRVTADEPAARGQALMEVEGADAAERSAAPGAAAAAGAERQDGRIHDATPAAHPSQR